MQAFTSSDFEDVRDSAQQALARACKHLARTQEADGAWRAPPAPRILENALICLLADAFVPELLPHVVPTRRWVRGATLQSQDEVPRVLNTWLQAVVEGEARSCRLDLTHEAFAEPVFAYRGAFFGALAIVVGSPVSGGIPRQALATQLLSQIRTRHVSRMKVWSSAEVAALFLLLTGEEAQDHAALALRALCEAQTPSGSFGENTVSTILAVAALRRWAPGSPELTRGLDFLCHTQAADGTWRFNLADVWDTALMGRVFGRCESFRDLMQKGVDAFLLRTQNADGGWPYRRDVESDTDTTGMAMLALSPAAAGLVGLQKGEGYLSHTRTEGGLWRTWLYRDDPPAEDVVAHAVLALRKCGAESDMWRPATDWLVTRLRENSGWRAQWYKTPGYAAHEIGMALGRSHPATRYAARLLVDQQNRDGGWGSTAGNSSTAAATGISLALLAGYFPVRHPVVARAVRYLVEAQDSSGAWSGPTDMYAPRPFAIDYPFQTHALAAIGLVEVANATNAPSGPESDCLTVEFRDILGLV